MDGASPVGAIRRPPWLTAFRMVADDVLSYRRTSIEDVRRAVVFGPNDSVYSNNQTECQLPCFPIRLGYRGGSLAA